HLGQVITKLETGTLNVGVAPTDMADAEHALRPVANRVGAAVIVASLLIASALRARVHDLRWCAFGGFSAAFVLGAYMLWTLMGGRGIANDSTIVLYGDKNNWFAAFAYWYLKIYGHEDVRILDGGRQKWIDEGRNLTPDSPSTTSASYTARDRDESIRTYRDS